MQCLKLHTNANKQKSQFLVTICKRSNVQMSGADMCWGTENGERWGRAITILAWALFWFLRSQVEKEEMLF